MDDLITKLLKESEQIVEKYEKNIDEHKHNFLDVIKYQNIQQESILKRQATEMDRIESMLVKDLSDIEEKRLSEENKRKNQLSTANINYDTVNNSYQSAINKCNNTYDTQMWKILDNYDANNNRIMQLKSQKEKFVDNERINLIKKYENENMIKQKMIEKSNEHFENQLKENKQLLINSSSSINEKIKEIKEFYIKKDEEINKEKEQELKTLDNKIKIINNQAVEKQKPILNHFKEELEKIDKERNTIKREYNRAKNKISFAGDKKIIELSSDINTSKYNFKKYIKTSHGDNKSASREIKRYIKNKQKEIRNVKSTLIKELDNELKKQNIRLIDIRTCQKHAELKKNLDISTIKAETNKDLSTIQEQIKHTNLYYDFLLKMRKAEELIEISKMENAIEIEEIIKETNDKIAILDFSFFKSDYQLKIDINNHKIESIKNTISENYKYNLDLINYEQQINDTINNLNIEKSKIQKDYITNQELLKLDYSKKMLESITKQAQIQEQADIDACEAREIVANIKYKKRLAILNGEINKALFKNTYENNIQKEKYTLNTQIEKAKRIISTTDAENMVIEEALTKLANEIHNYNMNLTKSISGEFKNMEPNDIFMRIEDVEDNKINSTKSICKTITKIISNRIDQLTAFKYNALKADVMDSFHESNEKLQNEKKNITENIIETNKSIKSLEHQLLYLMHDLSALKGRINLLNQKIYSYEKKIRKTKTFEIMELQELKKSSSSINNQINSLKIEKSKLNITLDEQTKEFDRTTSLINELNNTTNQKNDNLIKQRKSEMHIYYSTIDYVKSKENFLIQTFSLYANRLKKQYEISNNQSILQKIVNNDNKLFDKTIIDIKGIINQLKKNIAHEQSIRLSNYEHEYNDAIFKHKKNYENKTTSFVSDNKRIIDGYQLDIVKNINAIERIISEAKTNILIENMTIDNLNKKKQESLKNISINCVNKLKALDDNIFSITTHYSNIKKERNNNHHRKIQLINEQLNNEILSKENEIKNNALLHEREIESVSVLNNQKRENSIKAFNKSQHMLHKQINDYNDGIKETNKELATSLQELELDYKSELEELNNKYTYELNALNHLKKLEINAEKYKIYGLFKKKKK